MGSAGGLATVKKYGKQHMKDVGKLGGRPRTRENHPSGRGPGRPRNLTLQQKLTAIQSKERKEGVLAHSDLLAEWRQLRLRASLASHESTGVSNDAN